jgi:hypothetical protein
MKKLLMFCSLTLIGCSLIAKTTIPPPDTAYLRDPQIISPIDADDWKDPRHILIINDSKYYLEIRIDGIKIKFVEYIRKSYPTYFLPPWREADILLSNKGRSDSCGIFGCDFISESRRLPPIHIEVQGYLDPDFLNPVVFGEKTIEIDGRKWRQEVVFKNSDFSLIR